MVLMFQFDSFRTARDECLHLVKFRFTASLKPARIAKDETWVVSKPHYILDIVLSTLRTRQFMLLLLKAHATFLEAIKIVESI
jgi:hypothetical protein